MPHGLTVEVVGHQYLPAEDARSTPTGSGTSQPECRGFESRLPPRHPGLSSWRHSDGVLRLPRWRLSPWWSSAGRVARRRRPWRPISVRRAVRQGFSQPTRSERTCARGALWVRGRGPDASRSVPAPGRPLRMHAHAGLQPLLSVRVHTVLVGQRRLPRAGPQPPPHPLRRHARAGVTAEGVSPRSSAGGLRTP